MEFWNDMATEKSWGVLINLKKETEFILIGGWACYLLTKAIKSRDIDIILDFEALEKLRNRCRIKKTTFLRKYEAVIDGVSIDIYVPFYSRFSVPPEDIGKNTTNREGFDIPRPEILLILKQQAELSRRDSVKGQKDRTDIINLILEGGVEIKAYLDFLERYNIPDYRKRLAKIIASAKREFEYLNITNPREIKLIKKRILDQLRL
jgi:hypothetical protein